MKSGGNYMKLSIGKKISLGFAILLLSTLIIAAVSLFSLQSAKEDLNSIKQADTRAELASNTLLYINQAALGGRGFIAYGTETMAK
jgi:CHASE3 domain sensor protein